VTETVSLAVRTKTSMSKGGEEEASEQVAAYEFQSARRDGRDSLEVPSEAAVPPVNQASAVFCIAKADEVEEGEELHSHAYRRLPQPHAPPASLSSARRWPESVPRAGGRLPRQI
jgi:hypothetical protein